MAPASGALPSLGGIYQCASGARRPRRWPTATPPSSLEQAREVLQDDVDFERALRLLARPSTCGPRQLRGVGEGRQTRIRDTRSTPAAGSKYQQHQQHAEQQRLFAEARARMRSSSAAQQGATRALDAHLRPIDRILNATARATTRCSASRAARRRRDQGNHRACLWSPGQVRGRARRRRSRRCSAPSTSSRTRPPATRTPTRAPPPLPAQWWPSWTPPSAASAPDPTEAQIRSQLWATKVPGLKEFCRRMGIAAGNKKKEQLVGELYDRLAAYQPVENGLAHLQRMVDEHKRKDKLEAELRCASFLPEVWDSAAALRKLVTEAQTLGVAAGLFRAATQRCATLEAAERAAAAAKEAEERRAAAAERERRQREAEALAAAERERQRRIVEANERAAREERERRARAEAEAKARAEAEARARRQAAEFARAAEAEAEARVRAEAAARAEARRRRRRRRRRAPSARRTGRRASRSSARRRWRRRRPRRRPPRRRRARRRRRGTTPSRVRGGGGGGAQPAAAGGGGGLPARGGGGGAFRRAAAAAAAAGARGRRGGAAEGGGGGGGGGERSHPHRGGAPRGGEGERRGQRVTVLLLGDGGTGEGEDGAGGDRRGFGVAR